MPLNRADKNPAIPCYDLHMRFIGLFAALLLALAATPAKADGSVVVLYIDGGIGVATSEYITSGIEHAAETGAELIIIEKNDRLIHKFPNLPITLDVKKLSPCNKILCTGTTILNNSLDEVLAHCSPDAFV